MLVCVNFTTLSCHFILVWPCLACKCAPLLIKKLDILLYNMQQSIIQVGSPECIYLCVCVCVCFFVNNTHPSQEDSLHLANHSGGQWGTKIVLCLLPRLQHWQHDVAIHSQYCISLAFCEKVAANLSPQSTACQCEEGSSRGMGWRELGQLRAGTLRPVPLINDPSPSSVANSQLLFRQSVCSPSLQIKATAPASVWWVKIRTISMQAHVSLFLFAGTWWLEEGRRVEWGLDGVVTKKM